MCTVSLSTSLAVSCWYILEVSRGVKQVIDFSPYLLTLHGLQSTGLSALIQTERRNRLWSLGRCPWLTQIGAALLLLLSLLLLCLKSSYFMQKPIQLKCTETTNVA